MDFSGLNTGMPDWLRQRRPQTQNDPYGMLQQGAPSAPPAPSAGMPGGQMPGYLRQGLGFGGGQRGSVNGATIQAAYGGSGFSSTAPPVSSTPYGQASAASSSTPNSFSSTSVSGPAGGGGGNYNVGGNNPVAKPPPPAPHEVRPVGEQSPVELARRAGNRAFNHEKKTYHDLNQLSKELYRDYHTGYSPDMQASLIAPSLESLDESYKSAYGNLSQDLAARGLGDSSALTSGLGTLAGNRASAGSGIVSQLFQRQQDRQDQQRQQYGNLLQAMHSGSQSQMLAAISQYYQSQLQQKQLDQMGGGFNIGDLFSGLGGIAGGVLSSGSGSILGKLLGMGSKPTTTNGSGVPNNWYAGG